MDAIEILGGLLGRKASSSTSSSGSGLGGIGGKILKDILLGGGKSSPPASRESQPNDAGRSTGSGSAWSSPRGGSAASGGRTGGRGDLADQARELEELLNVAGKRAATPANRPSSGGGYTQAGPSGGSRSRTTESGFAEAPAERPSESRWGKTSSSGSRGPAESFNPNSRNSPFNRPIPQPPQNQNDHALVLVRAMINAAKADGQISHDEQQAILGQIGDSSPDTIAFLREEFNQPSDLKEFAWSVPQGLEEQVYALSLMAIELDKQSEANYLRDLAHALRIPADVCRQIHAHYGVPPLP